MQRLQTRIWRRLRTAYNSKRRQGRPLKLQTLQQHIHEDLESPVVSPVSVSEAVDSPLSTKSEASAEIASLERQSVGPEIAKDSITARSEVSEAGAMSSQEVEQQFRGVATGRIFSGAELVDAAQSSNDRAKDQEIRNKEYVHFDSEDEDDYTVRPARIVLANDGLKDCASLLMTLALSAEIQQALKAHRSLVKAKARINKLDSANFRFEHQLEGQIAEYEYRLLTLEEDDKGKAAERREILQDEIGKLQLLLECTSVRRRTYSADIQTRKDNLLEMFADLSAILDVAFVCARLLEPIGIEPNDSVEELSVEDEYQKLCKMARDETAAREENPLPRRNSQFACPSDPSVHSEDHPGYEVRAEYWRAHEMLRDAQCAFDNMDERRAQEWQNNYDAVERGEQALDASVEEFDLRWVECGRELTQKLIEAELVFAAAKDALVEAGIDIVAADQTYRFGGDDGGRLSVEQEGITLVAQPDFTTWLTGLSDPSSPSFNERSPEGDQWEANDVGISDSVSLVAEGADRKRIDKWRKVCGL